MRKSLIVLLFLAVAASVLIGAAITGHLSERAIAMTLMVLGVSLVVTRNSLVSWAHSVAETISLLGHWRLLRPLTVLLFGGALIAFSVIEFIAR